MAPYERNEVISGPPIELSSQHNMSAMPEGKSGELVVGVEKPHDNDVLFGRGGNINNHPGNETFRQIVEEKKRAYLTAQFKREKREIADYILNYIKDLNPPGRFLAKDSTGLWNDVGYEKARDKTSQALRENAPSIRKKIEDENIHLRAELQSRKEQEQGYPSHRGQQTFTSEDMNPSDYRVPHRPKETVSGPDLYNTYTGQAGYMPQYNNNPENRSPYNDHKRIIKTDHGERTHFCPDTYPYEGPFETDYRLPTDSEYGRKMTKKKIKAEHGSRPSSLPNLNDRDGYNCGMNAFTDLAESAGTFLGDFTPIPAMMRTTSAPHNSYSAGSSGEIRQSNPMHYGSSTAESRPGLDQIACESEDRTPAPSSMFGSCGAIEPLLCSFRQLTGTKDDDTSLQTNLQNCSLQSMEIESIEPTMREESNGSIGGQSLVHVFDNEEDKKKAYIRDVTMN